MAHTRIALEEHCMTPGLAGYWSPSVANLPNDTREAITRRLFDFEEERLHNMDVAGVARSILSVAGPGVQAESKVELACRLASESNDELARQLQRHPDRLDGFAHLPMQDANAAADELERCVTELGFKGALINGSTQGVYLDDVRYDAFWERTTALKVPVYLHPADPLRVFATI
jgi:2,3-dihydroxybenzoate decarboxylase